MRINEKLKVFQKSFKEKSLMHEAAVVALKKLNEYYTLATN